MGLGDAIMATADARRLKREFPDAHVVVGDGKEVSWSPMFENNPNITPPELFAPGMAKWVRNHIGNRPYIDYERTKDRLVYREGFRPEPGELFFTPKEFREGRARKNGDGYVVVEPHTKGSFSGNKEWPLDRWQGVVDGLKGREVVQLGAAGKAALRGVERVVTPSFRWAVEILSRASLVITTDGAMHHAAAAVDTPAVVLWGARTHPDILGYDMHVNLYTGSGESCGSIAPCDHCKQAMAKITPEMVLEACS